MRRLVILRHAKSDWERGTDDHKRPLNARGRRTAPAVGSRLVELGWSPEVVRSSDAQRTRETWALLAPSFPDAEVEFTRALYLADVEEIGAVIAEIADGVDVALVLGHNPGLSTAVLQLAGVTCEMRTGDAALLETDLGWRESVGGYRRYRLVDFIAAREVAP